MKVFLTSQSKQRSGKSYRRYVEKEEDAAVKAGFNVYHPNLSAVLTDEPVGLLKDARIFARHYAGEGWLFSKYIKNSGGNFIVPNYEQANYWYKLIDQEDIRRWFKRKLGYIDISRFDELEKSGSYEESLKYTEELAAKIFDICAVRGKVFVKAPHKLSIGARVYSKKSLIEAINYAIAFSSHYRLTELIYSEPINIAPAKTVYKKAEYRCLIVSNKCSTISIYCEHRTKNNYLLVQGYASQFATAFAGRLPNSYCLDIARLANGELAVVELNDIAGSGFYADHDIDKFYRDVYASA